VTEQDRQHWDKRYRATGVAPTIEPPAFLTDHLDLIPRSGAALDIACGRGRGSLWMASMGLDVLGVDVSPAAIHLARRGADRFGLADRCRFEVHDLDTGLPDPVWSADFFDMILCHLFRDPALYGQMGARLAPGGLLAVVVLAAPDGKSGGYRAEPDELARAFGALELRDHGADSGRLWLVATRPRPQTPSS
jgi:SAM-dependent methyltransferase